MGTPRSAQDYIGCGLDFGLNAGTTIFILPAYPNATNTPTLDVNGLGAQRILRLATSAWFPVICVLWPS